jgi:hypothetical protein
VSQTRTLAGRVAALAVFGLVLGASLAAAAPASKVGPLRKSAFGKGSSVGARTFGSLACVTQGIPCNTTVAEGLTTDDCRLPLDNSFYDAWTFEGVAGQTVQITLQSTAFDTYLFLLDPNGLELEENDDYPGGGTDSRITLELTDSGTYTIYANSYDPGETGAYNLQLVCSTGPPPASCSANSTTLCLNNGRFRVQAIFSAPSLGITNAPAQAVPLTGDTGYFWFFSANNVEIVIKAVDGRSFNNHFWVFYGALSDVEYTITVTDTSTGSVKPYHNTAGNLASVADTAAFAGSGAGASPAEQGASAVGTSPAIDEIVWAESARIAGLLSPETSQACTANATTLCLNNGRFQVQAIFSAPSLGITNAPAQAVPLTGDTGYFWFFSANNVEIVLKAVDGRAFNNYFWVFYGALSDVEYTITVTDTSTGAVKPYHNTAGHLASVADTAAFVP